MWKFSRSSSASQRRRKDAITAPKNNAVHRQEVFELGFPDPGSPGSMTSFRSSHPTRFGSEVKSMGRHVSEEFRGPNTFCSGHTTRRFFTPIETSSPTGHGGNRMSGSETSSLPRLRSAQVHSSRSHDFENRLGITESEVCTEEAVKGRIAHHSRQKTRPDTPHEFRGRNPAAHLAREDAKRRKSEIRLGTDRAVNDLVGTPVDGSKPAYVMQKGSSFSGMGSVGEGAKQSHSLWASGTAIGVRANSSSIFRRFDSGKSDSAGGGEREVLKYIDFVYHAEDAQSSRGTSAEKSSEGKTKVYDEAGTLTLASQDVGCGTDTCNDISSTAGDASSEEEFCTITTLFQSEIPPAADECSSVKESGMELVDVTKGRSSIDLNNDCNLKMSDHNEEKNAVSSAAPTCVTDVSGEEEPCDALLFHDRGSQVLPIASPDTSHAEQPSPDTASPNSSQSGSHNINLTLNLTVTIEGNFVLNVNKI